MPAGLSQIRKWVRQAHDAYSARRIGPLELTEIRRSASSVGDLYRTGAELRKAEAALRAAQAQERMAEALAAVEHGGAAVMLLARLQESLTDGRRRPLPGRMHSLSPAPEEPAS
jgi:transposase-like protein